MASVMREIHSPTTTTQLVSMVPHVNKHHSTVRQSEYARTVLTENSVLVINS